MKHSVKIMLLKLALPCALITPTPALAEQPASPLTIESDVQLVKQIVGNDGSTATQLVAPDITVPGDRLIFGLTYANSGAEPLANIKFVFPVPNAIRLSADTENSLIVSVDGGTQWGL